MTKRMAFILVFVCALTSAHISLAQPILVHGKLSQYNKKNISIPVKVHIDIKDAVHSSNHMIYEETNTLMFKDSGSYELLVGKGKRSGGSNSIDSIIWNLDDYVLYIEELNEKMKTEDLIRHSILLRRQTLPHPENQEGIVEAGQSATHGKIEIPLKQKKLPKKITIDLTTSYINIMYPGGRYPIFRHYEWYPTNKGKSGNCFMLTYSEKTTHEFWEEAEKKLGDVRIHDKPFQTLQYQISQDKLQIFLTEPEKVKFLSETYAIKGPWKIIYLIEWQ